MSAKERIRKESRLASSATLVALSETIEQAVKEESSSVRRACLSLMLEMVRAEMTIRGMGQQASA